MYIFAFFVHTLFFVNCFSSNTHKLNMHQKSYDHDLSSLKLLVPSVQQKSLKHLQINDQTLLQKNDQLHANIQLKINNRLLTPRSQEILKHQSAQLQDLLYQQIYKSTWEKELNALYEKLPGREKTVPLHSLESIERVQNAFLDGDQNLNKTENPVFIVPLSDNQNKVANQNPNQDLNKNANLNKNRNSNQNENLKQEVNVNYCLENEQNFCRLSKKYVSKCGDLFIL